MIILQLQLYVGDFKVYTNEGFFYVSNDGVSKHESEESFKAAIASGGSMERYFLYKGVHQELSDALNLYLSINPEDTWAIEIVEKIKLFKRK